jgi:hypothetical protein
MKTKKRKPGRPRLDAGTKGRPMELKEKDPPRKLVNFRVTVADKEFLERVAAAGRLSMTALIRGWMRMERSRLEDIKDRIKEKREELNELFQLDLAERERLQQIELGKGDAAFIVSESINIK